MRIDGDRGLDDRHIELAECARRPAKAKILMVGKTALRGARRLPDHRIGDLLQVAAEQGLDEAEHPSVNPVAGRDRIEIRRPLHETEGRAEARIVGHGIEHVAMAKRSWVHSALRLHFIEGGGERRHVGRIEDASYHCKAVLSVLFDVAHRHPSCLPMRRSSSASGYAQSGG